MSLSSRPFLLVAMLAVFLTTAVARSAEHVRDDGKFFRAETIQQAEQSLAQLKSGGGPLVIVETFAQPPADVRETIVNAPSPQARTAAFETFAGRRARDLKADVYVLANRTPGHVRIFEVREMQSRGLPATERDAIAATMVGAFRSQQYDRGLTEGLSQLTRALSGVTPVAAGRTAGSPTNAGSPSEPSAPANAPTGTPLPSAGGMGTFFCAIVGIGLVLMIIVTMVRRMSAQAQSGYSRAAGYGPQQGGPQGHGQGDCPQQPQQQGGAFGRGMAGGLLGGVLGSVLGGQMARGNSSNPNSGNDPQSLGGGHVPEDTGYASSGGDFDAGDHDSGGDFGGDSSGGDF